MQLRTVNTSTPTQRAVAQLATNPLFTDLFAKQGAELTAVQAQITRLDEEAAKVPAMPSMGVQFVQDALGSGGEIPDLLKLFAEDADNEARLAIATRELTALKSALVSRASQLAEGLLAGALQHLADKLTLTMSEARKVRAELGEARTAQAAIDDKKTKPWQQWIQLVDDYDQIRRAQQQVAHSDTWAELYGAGILRQWDWLFIVANPEELEPDLLAGQRRADTTPAWTSGLSWLIDNPDAQPWIPTPEQVHAKHDALENLRAGASRGRPIAREYGAQQRNLSRIANR